MASAERDEKLRQAYEAMLGQLRSNHKRLFQVCRAPVAPSYKGRVQGEVGTAATYFVPALEYRSGIPQFDQVARHERDIHPRGFMRHGSTLRLTIEEPMGPAQVVGFTPTSRIMGVLVTVSNVWDKTLIRKVKVPDCEMREDGVAHFEREEERQGDWRLVYRFSRRQTPLPAGIKTVHWS